mmetsp:Transcript_18277/g.29746  ORF Transcript_18277/g.29746 Transcript_18277/m.29746 type:complete len:117 (+) Transcript_18277:3-353(+)
MIQFILDGVQIWGWILRIRQKDEQENSDVNLYSQKKTCYVVLWSPYAVSAAYPATILFINLWVTLTWTVFDTDWSTSNGGSLTSLACRMIVAALGALSGASLFLHRGKFGRFGARS